ncbi:DNA repair protein RAD50 [Penicillium malachiteum]|uniref:DNA repair protein RAD50 n=1 Tax=Penicillium malachiteum TaxID=1324776 RepID=UPI00254820FD|nr:DNA repair protein RAD50 [Penicillium malachiteum]KAJ5736908.1 DNA repair protein RAD50 [Penicillium malachiteum]
MTVERNTADVGHEKLQGEERRTSETTLPAEEENGKEIAETPKSQTPSDDSAPPQKRSITGLKWALAYASVLSTVFLFALDGTIVAALQPSIVETFKTESDLSWIGVSFMLGDTAILPLGKAFGKFNIKWLFISCLFIFEVGSAVCGAAPTMDALIVGRVIAGVGGCGVYVGGLTFVALLTTDHERPLYLAGIYCIWGIGCVLGPIIGGAFAQSSATWRWGFYINLPIAAVFAPAQLFCLPAIRPQPDKSFMERIRSLDWIGTIVFLAGATCFSMALSFGGTEYAWSSGSEIALLVMTGVLFIAFVLATIFHPGVVAENKLLPVGFMRTADLITLPIQSAIVAGAMYTSIYYVPLLFQFTKSDSALEGGVRMLPLICALVFFALLNATFMPKLGYYMPWYVFGNAAVIVGSALMFTINSKTSAAHVYGYTFLIGVGVGCFQSAGVAVASAIAAPADVNNAVSLMTIAQICGVLASLCVDGAVFQNLAISKISSVLPGYSESDISSLTAGTSGSVYQNLTSAQQSAVVDAVSDSIRRVFLYPLAVSASGFLLSFTLSRRKLYLAEGKVAK